MALFTTRTLGFAQSIAELAENDFNFLATPTIIGTKANDVTEINDASAGLSTLLTSFSIAQPGDPLPNFLDVALNSPETYSPVEFSFKSTTFGNCSDGRAARLDVHQIASTNESNELIFSIEKVEAVG